MKLFQPQRVFFEEDALEYPLGAALLERMKAEGVPVRMTGSHNRVTGIPGANPQQSYSESKRTLVVGVKRDLRLDTCKPSADFEFALGTSCPGGCEYCYLQTHLGKKPYIRVYVNTEAILEKVAEITAANAPRITTFEAASTSDPLAVEHLTGSLAQAIRFFGAAEFARMRVVTKFAAVDSLLELEHRGHTRFRFSLNAAEIIRRFEHNTASAAQRIAAAGRIARAGYPLGFIIAPLFIYPGYQAGYRELFRELARTLDPIPPDLSFELITHRFTASAKRVILERFPGTGLDLDETRRRRKYGQYGLVKYIYPEAEYAQLKETIQGLLARFFPAARIEYFT
ncbi:spore photoproduct lyase [Hydrogenispora ethanolica]|uniref:Spore photoproduct lyase n=1 Tax=Hydrogenispora ethanolica TaxID=1082276 RepID=A0A4R1S2U2_HYDET|nr:spore photoproduct lyase [Hydrogenispora ethanolica]TCL73224.1 spore photoproduct lyase [Hydrogenispora ethanolica]